MILMNDFTRMPLEVRRAEDLAIKRVLDSGWSILGREVEAFEHQWAETVQASACLGVGNGLDALEIGLRALGIGPGDEVITTPMTAFATVLAILRAGASPVLADIVPGTALMDLESVKRCLSAHTKAVMLVHLYGQAHRVDEWSNWCHDQDIHLIEDCAQSHLAVWKGRPAGSWGIFSGWSFYPTKNLGAVGDAGALTTDSKELAALASSLRNYGQSERYHHPHLGMNSRLDEIQAGILAARLPSLVAWTKRRRAIAAAYFEGIKKGCVALLNPPAEVESHVYHLFVLRTAERKRFAEHMHNRHVQTLIHYPIPIHHQPPCAGLRHDPLGLKAAERHGDECLSIPCNPFLTDDEVDHVIQAVNAFN
jgi:dTDP-4-amino-4,6-dideoxygalactose transaminase